MDTSQTPVGGLRAWLGLTSTGALRSVGIISAIVLVVLDKAGKLKGPVLFVLLAIAAGMTIPLVFSIPCVANAEGPQRFARCSLMACLVGVAYSLLSVWIPDPFNRAHDPHTIMRLAARHKLKFR